MSVKSFKDLVVWQKPSDLTGAVYETCADVSAKTEEVGKLLSAFVKKLSATDY